MKGFSKYFFFVLVLLPHSCTNKIADTNGLGCGAKKYEALFRPNGHDERAFYDYEQALCVSKKSQKPLLLVFSAWACVNCSKMEAQVFKDPKVAEMMHGNCIVAYLYVDDRTALPENEWFTSQYFNTEITKLGEKNVELQTAFTRTGSQPICIILQSGDNLKSQPFTYTKDKETFMDWLFECLGK